MNPTHSVGLNVSPIIVEPIMKKIIFYNDHQNGDIALCRGIIDTVINNCETNAEFYFLMSKKNNLQFNNKVKVIYGNSNNYGFGNDCIAINLWIGSSPTFMNRTNAPRNAWGNPVDYNISAIYDHYCEIINLLNSNTDVKVKRTNDETDMIPKSCKDPHRKKEVDSFLESINHFNKKVLVCNGTVHSLQCPNFDLRGSIYTLVNQLKDTAFIYTKSSNNFLPNEFSVNHFVSIPNLLEIDYLSTKCDVLISRRSGPGEVIQTYDNFFDSAKSFIFTTDRIEASAIYNKGTCKIFHTSDYSNESIQNIIKKCIICQ